MLERKAFAKINLTLSVGQKRADGYHDIDTIMHRISLCDTIRLEKDRDLSLSVCTKKIPTGKDNLMWKAATLFFSETRISGGVHMELQKEIPSEAGLGGGSADAATVIVGLCDLYDIPFSLSFWLKKSAVLGADVPFSFLHGAAHCTGIGTDCTPLPSSLSLFLVVVQPHFSLSTRDAYHAMDENKKRFPNRTKEIASFINRSGSLSTDFLYNDFETVLLPLYPPLQDVINYGNTYKKTAHLTGSGSAFFFLCDSEKEQKDFIVQIKKDRPLWFVAPARTLP